MEPIEEKKDGDMQADAAAAPQGDAQQAADSTMNPEMDKVENTETEAPSEDQA